MQRGWFLRGEGESLSAKRVGSPGGGASLCAKRVVSPRGRCPLVQRGWFLRGGGGVP